MRFPRPVAATFAVALMLASPPLPAADADSGATQDDIKADVQVSELGMMRALLLLDDKSMDSEKIIEQRLSDSDFRVFPSPMHAEGNMDMDEMKALGKKEQADLIVYAIVTTRLKNKMDDFSLYEGEATVQVFSPVTGEMLATQNTRVHGERNEDDVEAERSAREKALDEATKDVVIKVLAKAQKMLVHEATITGVYSNRQLLSVMEYMGRMDGVYGVRQVSYDTDAHVGIIDIIGSPRSETYWRAYLEKMPKAKIVVKVVRDEDLRKKYPSWFSE